MGGGAPVPFVNADTIGSPRFNPFGVAVDSSDNIIVMDVAINLVQIFDSEETPSRS